VIFTVLALVSCAAWLWSARCTWRMLRDLPDLDDPVAEPARWPSLSLVVPARDEADTLAAALSSRLRDDYPELEVVAVDDRSSDGTGPLLERLAHGEARLRVVHVRELPPGWLGKVHALARGAEAARGEWLLFSDADVHVVPGTLRRAVALAQARGWDMLAVLPCLEGGTFALRLGLCGFLRGFNQSRRLWKVADPADPAHVGIGAFNLVRRAALERTAGLEWLRMDVADDVALGLLLKRSGARCGVAHGERRVRVAWYADLPSMLRGLEKNTFAVLHCSLARAWGLAAAALALELPAWLALWTSEPRWLAPLCALALLPALAVGALAARRAGLGVAAALPAPLGTLIQAWVLVRAGWLGTRRGGVSWRGTFYSSAELRAGRRVDALG
jgi:cellulose synthase/poly-beta-1,6-N-acetylglucosamine synthase-like glycosyltransferase